MIEGELVIEDTWTDESYENEMRVEQRASHKGKM